MKKGRGGLPPIPLVARLTIMVVAMLTNHNDVIWQLFDPVEVYKKVHSLKRVFMRKHYFGMDSFTKDF